MSRRSENGDVHYSEERGLSSRKSGRRSYSRERSGSHKNKYRSRSRSKSYRSNYSKSRSRSYSRSPSYRGRKGSRPEPNRCIGVFGLSVYTTERQVREIFDKYGRIDKVQIIYDARSGRSRGFCFVYYETKEEAKVAREECNGIEIDGRRIRVDYSVTQRPHTPTPGIYMGFAKSDNRRFNRRRYYGDGDDYYGGSSRYRGGHRRSPSPYRSSYRRSRHERDRSRSRSYSSRRY